MAKVWCGGLANCRAERLFLQVTRHTNLDPQKSRENNGHKLITQQARKLLKTKIAQGGERGESQCDSLTKRTGTNLDWWKEDIKNTANGYRTVRGYVPTQVLQRASHGWRKTCLSQDTNHRKSRIMKCRGKARCLHASSAVRREREYVCGCCVCVGVGFYLLACPYIHTYCTVLALCPTGRALHAMGGGCMVWDEQVADAEERVVGGVVGCTLLFPYLFTWDEGWEGPFRRRRSHNLTNSVVAFASCAVGFVGVGWWVVVGGWMLHTFPWRHRMGKTKREPSSQGRDGEDEIYDIAMLHTYIVCYWLKVGRSFNGGGSWVFSFGYSRSLRK